MADIGKGISYGATGAAIGAPAGPIGAGVLGAAGFLYGAFGGGGDNEAAAPTPMQYGGNPLTNQLAAQQYAAGLQQQQAQNAREAAFYGNAQGNFDIANAAQMRGGPQITSAEEDRARQIAALGGTDRAILNVNQTGNQLSALGNQSSNQVTATGDRLTALGTKPMGPSYAEAQLRQGQDAAMAQQLSMARSGRSLGSGQAAMNQAMFNNAALNQQTNLGAANARIQEQNAYNQFQAGTLSQAGQQYNANNQFQASALGQAGQVYGSAGALSGQAGNQATSIRQGNEGVQMQNAQLAQNQQGINNQTTGLYNQLGAQQQGYGMQANAQGQNAAQFGANQASGMQGAQLNADTGRLSAATQIAVANQNNANAHDAANVSAVASGAGAISDAFGNANASAPAGNANNPSGSTSPYAPITKASNTAGPTASDERLKTNIKALGGAPIGSSSGGKPGMMGAPKKSTKYDEFSPEDAAAYKAADAQARDPNYKGSGRLIDDENAGKVAVTGEPTAADQPASYAETIAALNNGYRASQFAPADVLNHVPGAGAPPSASQSALLSHFGAPGSHVAPAATQAGGIARAAQAADYSTGRANGDSLSRPDVGMFASGNGGATGISPQKVPLTGATRSPAAAPPPPAAWGDVFNAPQFDARVTDYLAGGSPYQKTVTGPESVYSDAYSAQQREQAFKELSGNPAPAPAPASPQNSEEWFLSDARSKTRIRELEGQLAALKGGPPSARFPDESEDGGGFPRPRQPDTAALDQAHSRAQQAPAVDFRPARPYEYEYKDPAAPGAAPGKHVGPMAQDLLRSSTTAATVHDTPQGLQVDTPRLTLAVAGAMSEQQRKTEELERQLAALSGSKPAAYDPKLYPQTRAPR